MTTPASLLHPEAFLSPLAIDEAVQRALDEDLGRAGDITSIATIPEATHAHAVLVARQAGVIAGLPLAVATFHKLSPDISIQAHVRDGSAVATGVHVLTISGPARAVLAGERTALNFVGRLSGIATLTRTTCAIPPAPNCASAAPARPRPACARWRNMRCAAAAASIIASGSTMRS